MKINYFGKPYSFTHLAAIRRFGENHKYLPRDTIDETVNNLEKNSIAIVPIENTYGGIINETMNLFIENKPIKILEELEMRINLYLLSNSQTKLPKIKRIYSHDYPLKVSEGWIRKNMPNAEVRRAASTSDACCKIREEKYSCAIASEEAAEYYGLKKLGNIKIEGKKNITRFFVIRAKN